VHHEIELEGIDPGKTLGSSDALIGCFNYTWNPMGKGRWRRASASLEMEVRTGLAYRIPRRCYDRPGMGACNEFEDATLKQMRMSPLLLARPCITERNAGGHADRASPGFGAGRTPRVNRRALPWTSTSALEVG